MELNSEAAHAHNEALQMKGDGQRSGEDRRVDKKCVTTAFYLSPVFLPHAALHNLQCEFRETVGRVKFIRKCQTE